MFCRIHSVAHYLPARTVSNAELVEKYGYPKSAEWLERKTGIRQRHFAGDSETTTSMAEELVRKLMTAANLRAVDLLIFTSNNVELACPSSAMVVAGRTGIGVGMAYDLMAACAGFAAAVEMARGAFMTGMKTALVVSSEIHTRCLDFTDHKTGGLFGDGAGAALLEASTTPGVEASAMGSLPEGHEAVVRYHRPNEERKAKATLFDMPGNRYLTETMEPFMTGIARSALDRAGVRLSDIRWTIPHQANGTIVDAIARKLEVPSDRLFKNVEDVANTASASIPICVSQLVESGRLSRGDRILTISAGAGLTGIAQVITY